MQCLGYSESRFPIKYLGIPLVSTRLLFKRCQPLIDKILCRLTSWTSKLLSYAGRVQLIRSVLFALQVFWSQCFIIPKSMIVHIESFCGQFLWSGQKHTAFGQMGNCLSTKKTRMSGYFMVTFFEFGCNL